MANCVVCEALRPSSDPFYADYNEICAFDYGLLTSWLRSLEEMNSELLAVQRVEPDLRTWWKPWLDRQNQLIVIDGRPMMREEAFVDPVGANFPVGPIRSNVTDSPRVSGSRERPLGVPAGPLNLASPVSDVPYLRRRAIVVPSDTPVLDVRVRRDVIKVEVDGKERAVEVWERCLPVDAAGRPQLRWAGDRVGAQPVALFLDRALAHWISRGAPGRMPEDRGVASLVRCLLNSLDWATRWLPNLGDFAVQLRRERGALRQATGQFETQPTLCQGVVCGACGNATLFRKADFVECEFAGCGRLYNDLEFDDLRDAQNRARVQRKRKAA